MTYIYGESKEAERGLIRLSLIFVESLCLSWGSLSFWKLFFSFTIVLPMQKNKSFHSSAFFIAKSWEKAKIISIWMNIGIYIVSSPWILKNITKWTNTFYSISNISYRKICRIHDNKNWITRYEILTRWRVEN